MFCHQNNDLQQTILILIRKDYGLDYVQEVSLVFDSSLEEPVVCPLIQSHTNLFRIKQSTRRFSTNSMKIKMPCVQFQMSVNKKQTLSRDTKYEIPSIIHVTPINIDSRKYNKKLKFREKKTEIF